MCDTSQKAVRYANQTLERAGNLDGRRGEKERESLRAQLATCKGKLVWEEAGAYWVSACWVSACWPGYVGCFAEELGGGKEMRVDFEPNLDREVEEA